MSETSGMIGVLGAMESEVSGLVAAMEVRESGITAGFPYWVGTLAGREVVVGRSGMGKVSAASGVQRLIDRWGVSCVVVCGLAGALAADLRIGDVVVGDEFVQYDLDASPIFPRFEVPGLGLSRFPASEALVSVAVEAAREVEAEIHPGDLTADRGIEIRRGLIATGDRFVKDDEREAIRRDFPDALCVEMEGCAIAQVCHLNGVAFLVIRVISDAADGDAPGDFLRFVEEQAPRYTVGIVRRLLPRMP